MKTLHTFYLIALMIVCANVFAQMPKTISYQGQVVDGSNQPVSGSHMIVVKLYDVPNGGAALHSESFTTNFDGGYFSVMLGTQTAFSPSVLFDKQYWLGITLDGGSEMNPRTAMTGAPYAMMAGSVASDAAVTKLNGLTGLVDIEGANGTTVTKNGNTITISAGGGGNGVTNINGQQGAITLQGAGGTTITNVGSTFTISSSGGGGTGIQGVQSLDGSLSITNPNGPTATINLAVDAVKNVNIGDNAVNTAEIAANAVTSTKIADGSIGTSKIVDASVTTAKINDGAITASKVGVNQINGLHILGDCITATHIATNGVNTAEIANGAVTLPKISSAGAASGNVLTYNGANIVWAAPAGGGSGITTLTNGDGMITISNPTGPTATLNLTNSSITSAKLNTDASSLAKVSGNFFTASGAGTVLTNADVKFTVDTQAIIFPSCDATNEPMIYMFASGEDNGNRMVLGHSPSYPTWGLQYRDTPDEFRFLSNGTTVMNVDLGDKRVGIGDIDPSAKLEIENSASGYQAALIRQTSTSTTASSLKATTASTNTAGFAIEGVAVNGSAVVAQNNSSNTASLVAINTNATANAPIFDVKTSTGAGYRARIDREGDMELMGHLSARENLGSSATPADGGVYFDNVIYAWGHVATNGVLTSGYGMSVSKTGTGTYAITYNKTLTNGSAPVATAWEASSPQFAVVSARSSTGCTIKIWKFNAGSFSLVDSDFFVHVVGRPDIF